MVHAEGGVVVEVVVVHELAGGWVRGGGVKSAAMFHVWRGRRVWGPVVANVVDEPVDSGVMCGCRVSWMTLASMAQKYGIYEIVRRGCGMPSERLHWGCYWFCCC